MQPAAVQQRIGHQPFYTCKLAQPLDECRAVERINNLTEQWREVIAVVLAELVFVDVFVVCPGRRFRRRKLARGLQRLVWPQHTFQKYMWKWPGRLVLRRQHRQTVGPGCQIDQRRDGSRLNEVFHFIHGPSTRGSWRVSEG